LHAHDKATSVKLTRNRGGETVENILSIDPFHGYGADQTFKLISDGSLKPGDSLSFTCVYDTNDVETRTYYGVNHGDEMCAPILLYYPHVNDIFTKNVISLGSSHNDDLGAEDIEKILEEEFSDFKRADTKSIGDMINDTLSLYQKADNHGK